MTINLKSLPSRYEATKMKFSGGQGDVYICQDKSLERKVAIKFIQSGGDPKALITELNALQSIRSKHVVEIFDIIQVPQSNAIGLVQEFVPGDDLCAKIPKQNNQLKSDEFISLMHQMASGVRDIHASGSIHRDLKPTNIKINAEGILKIFDFGLAKDLKPVTSTAGFKGTFGFAAPELYANPPKFNESVDVFAMGATAWVLATGNFPAELKQLPPTKLASSLAATRPDLPKSVIEIIDNSLEVDPLKRPSSIDFSAVFARRLTYGKHVGILAGKKRYLLDKPGAALQVDLSPLGQAIVSYDGEKFFLEVKSGEVFLNAKKIVGKVELTGASVLIFGDIPQGAARVSLPFFVSHPEIVL